MNRWSKNGVLDRRSSNNLQRVPVDPHQAVEAVSLDSTVVKVPILDGTVAWLEKKRPPSPSASPAADGPPRFISVAADARTALTFALSPGQAHDGPEGRKLLTSMGPQDADLALVMDRAYQGNETRQLALDLGFTPVVPPLKARTVGVRPGRCTSAATRSSCLLPPTEGLSPDLHRRTSRRLDVMFIGFIHFVLAFDALT